MAAPRAVAIDFETEPIRARPHYPPKPVGVAVRPYGGRGQYLGWGHPTGNNTTREKALSYLRRIWESHDPLVFHNAKFDLDVAETHLGLPMPEAGRIHDTMIAAFLHDPYSRTLKLKPLGERFLKMPPTERDELRAWIFEHVPEVTPKSWGAWICKAPGDLVGRYAAGDVERTGPLLDFLWPAVEKMTEAYNREIRLIEAILETEREGMSVDREKLSADLLEGNDLLERCDDWIRKRLKTPGLIVDERESLADAIDKSGLAENGWVLTPTGKRSTKKGALEEAISDKLLVAMLSYRGSLATCLRTFMTPWNEMAKESPKGRVHTTWHSTRGDTDHGARTGRLSSTPNLQNIPTDFEKIMPLLTSADLFRKLKLPSLPQVRSYVVADSKKHVLCGRDYNGQELRVLAHYEDGDLAAQYHADPRVDIHQYVSDSINADHGLSTTRKIAKTLNFLKIYGGGVPKLAANLGVDLETAKAIMRAYESILPGLADLNKDLKRMGRANEPIRTLGGRMYYVEPPRMVNGRLNTYEYKLLNYLVQGSSADMTKEAWLRYRSRRRSSRLVLTVHDEIVICAPKSEAEAEMRFLREAMESVALDVPLLSDGEIGYRWTEMKGV